MKLNVFALFGIVVAGLLFVSCQNDSEPDPTPATHTSFIAQVASEVTVTGALIKGDLTIGSEKISDCGFVWSTEHEPTLSSSNKHFGTFDSDQSLFAELKDLLPRTTYYFRTFYTSGSATAYGEELSFETKSHAEFKTEAAEGILFTEATLSGELSIYNDNVFECGFVWGKTPNPNTSTSNKQYFGPQTENTKLSFGVVGLSINTTYYFNTFIITSAGIFYGEERSFKTSAEVEWTEPGEFPGEARMAGISFVIEGKAYVGLGHGRDATGKFAWYKDFWEFDIMNNSWTKLKDYPGEGASGTVAFVINKKGYVGTGAGPTTGSSAGKNDFWEYDPASDTWTRKADFIGSAVSHAAAFSLNGKGYVGTGVEFGNGNFLKTFYEYDPSNNVWARKADFPGLAVDQAVGFSIGELGYIGMGLRQESWLGATKQLWAYSPVTDSWTQKKDCPSPDGLEGSVAFVMNEKGYVGLGWSTLSIWKYDPGQDDWVVDGEVQKMRTNAITIPIDQKVLIGTGASASAFYKDFEEYIPK